MVTAAWLTYHFWGMKGKYSTRRHPVIGSIAVRTITSSAAMCFLSATYSCIQEVSMRDTLPFSAASEQPGFVDASAAKKADNKSV